VRYADHLAADRRLALLRLIAEDGGQSNDGALLTAMRMIGQRVNLDQAAVRQLLKDLAERDCVTIELARDTIMVAKITERGRMAIAGDVSIGGVASPHQGL
jgi:DNA-binding MarR family transcriptional regulator